MEITAAVVRQKGGPFAQERLQLDSPRADEVLVRIVATGMCHSDLVVVHQQFPLPLPWVLGHEGAGVVLQVGATVSHVKPGDHVVLSFASCGECHNCHDHQPAYCDAWFALNTAGARRDGAATIKAADGSPVNGCFFGQSSFASHSLAHKSNVVKVPKDAPLHMLGPLGCGIQTGAGAVLNVLKPREGSSIAIFGTGAVGLAAQMGATIAGCGTIVAVDLVPSRLELARSLGATHVINAAETNAVEVLLAMGGMDFTVEAVGSPTVVDAAVKSLRPRGTCAVLGVAAPGVTLPVELAHLAGGRTITGITEGSADPQQFIPYLTKQFMTGRLPLDRLIRFYDLQDINQAMHDSESGVTVKPVIRVCAEV